MANFTLTLDQVIEFSGGTVDVDSVTGIAKITPKFPNTPVNIGLSTYPIHDPAYRDTLNGKIIDHYLNREIGRETISDFRRALRMRMNEIMPAYVEIYKSTLIEFTPLSTVDLQTTSTSDGTTATTAHGTNTSDTSTDSKARTVTSDTPQAQLSQTGDYATGLADAVSDTTGTSAVTEDQNSNVTANGTNTSATTGYQGLASDLIIRFRESIIAVDRMVINELEDLFMQVWDTPDNYTHYNVGSNLYGWH